MCEKSPESTAFSVHRGKCTLDTCQGRSVLSVCSKLTSGNTEATRGPLLHLSALFPVGGHVSPVCSFHCLPSAIKRFREVKCRGPREPPAGPLLFQMGRGPGAKDPWVRSRRGCLSSRGARHCAGHRQRGTQASGDPTPQPRVGPGRGRWMLGPQAKAGGRPAAGAGSVGGRPGGGGELGPAWPRAVGAGPHRGPALGLQVDSWRRPRTGRWAVDRGPARGPGHAKPRALGRALGGRPGVPAAAAGPGGRARRAIPERLRKSSRVLTPIAHGARGRQM
jgi:hypothetical protein